MFLLDCYMQAKFCLVWGWGVMDQIHCYLKNGGIFLSPKIGGKAKLWKKWGVYKRIFWPIRFKIRFFTIFCRMIRHKKTLISLSTTGFQFVFFWEAYLFVSSVMIVTTHSSKSSSKNDKILASKSVSIYFQSGQKLKTGGSAGELAEFILHQTRIDKRTSSTLWSSLEEKETHTE